MKKVLIVDDDASTRCLLAQIVESVGGVSVESSNGERALNILADNSGIDLVITDMVMPKMGGRELVNAIRESKKYDNIPIILISGIVRLSEITDLLESGVRYFVPKPVNRALVTEYLQNVLTGRITTSASEMYAQKPSQ